jgi:hypothetical protein
VKVQSNSDAKIGGFRTMADMIEVKTINGVEVAEEIPHSGSHYVETPRTPTKIERNNDTGRTRTIESFT